MDGTPFLAQPILVTNIFIDYPLVAFSLSSALLQKMNFIDASL